MDDAKFNEIVESIIRQVQAAEASSNPDPIDSVISKVLATSDQESIPLPPTSSEVVASSQETTPKPQTISWSEPSTTRHLQIDLPDPTSDENRFRPQVDAPENPAALKELIASTSSRIGVGRSGPRYKTASQLLFQGDHAITQDALYKEVDAKLLAEFNLFSVRTRITEGKAQFLLRPDLGRQLDEASKQMLAEKCLKNPNIQIAVGDGLSATAIEANLRQIMPVLLQGFQNAGLSVGTPFYIRYCRVGVMNDIGEAIKPDILILLIGERPGLGRAESMSAYMGYQPKIGNNDADRDVICNIFENGGTNPLEAGAFIVQFAQKMLKHQASGVKLKLATK